MDNKMCAIKKLKDLKCINCGSKIDVHPFGLCKECCGW